MFAEEGITLPLRKRPSQEATGGIDKEARRAADAVERALEQVGSQEEAERLLADLERRQISRTQPDAEDVPPDPALSAPETVGREVDSASAEEKPAVALECAVEQTTGEPDADLEQLAESVHGAFRRPRGDRLKPHAYLQQAVLRRMTPLQAWDASLYIAINRLPRNRYTTKLMVALSTVSMHGSGWVAGVLLLATMDGHKGRRTATEMIPAVLVTNTLVERIIKVYFRRRRPFITMVKALVIGRKPGSWSFPSGHSACSFACASVLSRRYGRRRSVFYSLASLVAFSRVYLGHHYPSDVLSGATIGEVASRGVVWLVHRTRRP